MNGSRCKNIMKSYVCRIFKLNFSGLRIKLRIVFADNTNLTTVLSTINEIKNLSLLESCTFGILSNGQIL